MVASTLDPKTLFAGHSLRPARRWRAAKLERLGVGGSGIVRRSNGWVEASRFWLQDEELGSGFEMV